ncbi:microtubule associated protein-domain-containing protein [Elsinoe ampelina]|uniref:Microtubule associated protein-domain-containing protein n=1 Tax=Elsinoe ampelina TaxID=302913 RepID=A0A6A6GK54_9PEZI|nr:microtubule associated protein-domain-containing protein [Elsinoe ampelina]
MDTSYLSQQVTTIVNQLHGYFDEIGVPTHERDQRESELFSALSETLHNQLKLVASEKHELTEQARQLIRTIRQMEAALDDTKVRDDYDRDDDDLQVTCPLLSCIDHLKQKHKTIAKLHRERYEQVKRLAEALGSYASHIEPSFLTIKLPPTSPNAKLSPTFDISPTYVAALDNEFTRVYDEYNRRVALVQQLAEEIVMLWGELGTPQAQVDSTIVKCYRDAPEQLGLHQDDITRIKARREKLIDEKRAREKRLKDLRATVEQLWEKLGIENADRKAFLAANRGCGMRTINEFEDELAKLEEMKRQNLHLFVEDARFKLQELWDNLYFSEEEMMEFTPAFSDVYSDALLSAHEAELARLEALKQQRAPILASVEEYRSLIKDREDLAASSQDASRLLGKGAKGEKRDPTRLLREEKMRKRIQKTLPKVEAELRKVLTSWEDEYGRPFLVHGERYLDELESLSAPPVRAAPPRSKTPINPPPAANTKSVRTAPPASRNGTMRGLPPRSKTPNANLLRERNPLASSVHGSSTLKASTIKPSTVRGSPSKIPSRQPLGGLADGGNSPERRPKTASGFRTADTENLNTSTIKARPTPGKPATLRANPTRMGPPARVAPPKMKDFFPPTPTPTNYSDTSDHSSVIVRHVDPEDVYDDQSYRSHPSGSTAGSMRSVMVHGYPSRGQGGYPMAPPSRLGSNNSQSSHSSQVSHVTHSTAVSGSENWETYTDASDEDYYQRRAEKRLTPDDGFDEEQVRKGVGMKGLGLGIRGGGIMGMERAREGTVEGSEAWTETDDGEVF